MNDKQRVRAEAIGRSVEWLGNQGLTIGSVLASKYATLQAHHEAILLLAGQLAAGSGSKLEEFSQKRGDRETLREQCATIANIASAMADEFPGIDLQYRFRRNLNDQDLLALARGFATNAVAHSADFIAYGLAPTFIADLTAAADAFQASIGDASMAMDTTVGIRAQLDERISQAMQLKRSIGIMVETQFPDTALLAAWASASRVESLAHTKKETPPTP